MKTLKLEWSEFKEYYTTMQFDMNYHIEEDHYDIWATDGLRQFDCILYTDDETATTDQLDFETNYKANCNQKSYGRAPVHTSPRPFGTTTYFAGAGDTTEVVGDGERIMFDMKASDAEKSVDISFNEGVYFKDGFILTENAPFGSAFCITLVHPVYGVLSAFAHNINMLGSFRIPLDTSDRSPEIPAGIIMRFTIFNSTETPADFKIVGNMEMYRKITL